ncbi:MAG TPA: hypothetical protein VE326_12675 [Candidatus Binatia bacterium]|nr:hypothetical protein [Candidatus Binatia bacterium]
MRAPLWLPQPKSIPGPAVFLPALVVAFLSAPGLSFDYFWDDFFFLTRAQGSPTAYLTPNAAEAFWRPIPQGLYFRLLLALGPAGPLAGHLLNLLLLAAAATLLATLAARLAGPRTGLLAGLVFAASAALPSLVAWTSASQDLMAMVFVLIAFHLRESGKIAASAALAALALLSKETAAVALPVLVGWDWLLGRTPSRLKRGALLFGIVTAAWFAVHPGLRALVHAGLQSGTTGYVGLERPDRWWDYLFRYVATLFNFPVNSVSWPARLTVAGIAAGIAVLAIAPAALERLRPADVRTPSGDLGPGQDRPRPTARRLQILGLLVALPPILLPSLLVRPWAAYFAALAVPGFAILAAPRLARLTPRTAAIAMAAFLLLGVWARGMDARGNGRVLTEQRFAEASLATRTVRERFRKIVPEIPAGARVLLSVAGTGTLGIHQSLQDGQALRHWYREPTIATVQPEWKRPPGADEFLIRVTPDLQVIQIDPTTSRFRAEGDDPDREEIAKPIRSYARGLAASGATDPAVWILERMATADSARLRSYDLRLAALALHAAHRDGEAAHLLRLAPPLQRWEALDMAGKVYAEPTHDPAQDALAFWPFGVSPDDPDALRYLIGQYRIGGYHRQARELARRLERVAPGDSLALATIRFNPLRE